MADQIKITYSYRRLQLTQHVVNCYCDHLLSKMVVADDMQDLIQVDELQKDLSIASVVNSNCCTRLNKRFEQKRYTITYELHEAMVFLDALLHYINYKIGTDLHQATADIIKNDLHKQLTTVKGRLLIPTQN